MQSILLEMYKIKTELETINNEDSYSKCHYCHHAKVKAENELFPKVDYRETKVMNLNQQIQNLECLKQELIEKNRKL